MYAKYKFTKYIADQISELRKKILGYSHEFFGENILQSSQTTSYYLCDPDRRKAIEVDLLRKIYLIKYNAYLFVRKQATMDRMLKLGIINGDILPKTNLKKMFGTKNSLSSTFNPDQICIPKEIFLLKKCVIPKECVNTIGKGTADTKNIMENFFDENNFSEELRYVPTEYDSLNNSERIRFDAFLIDQIEVLLKNCNEDMLRTEYWLYGMYLMHKNCVMHAPLQQYINRMYFDNENRTDWNAIFEKLQKNEYIKRISQYECDMVYFKDEDSSISKEDFPLFVYKYKSRYADEYVERIHLANKGSVKLIDLFMTIYNYNMSIGKSENTAFKLTCMKLYAYNVYIPFDNVRLDLFPLPTDPDIDATAEATVAFHTILNEFFKDVELDEEKDIDIIRFNNNRAGNPIRFMKAISFDFKFINKLNNEMATELRDELKKTAEEFKRANKL